MFHENTVTDGLDFSFGHLDLGLGFDWGVVYSFLTTPARWRERRRAGESGEGLLLAGLVLVHDLEIGVDDVGLLFGFLGG
ncbi:MAG TPA: hypothetical protein VIO38_00835, partial [Rariglobus sp.]